METAIAAFLRPFALLILGVLILYPIRRSVERMTDGRLKRFLLTRNPVAMSLGVFIGYAVIVLLVTEIN